MTYTQPGLFDGQTRKELGQDQVLRNVGNQWQQMALDCICDLADSRKEFTSDDLRMSMDILKPNHPNSIGAVFSIAAKQKFIRKTGEYVRSRIPSCHARVIAVWTRV